MRDKPPLPELSLHACIRYYYNLIPITIKFLPLGLDSNAGVYRVVSEQGIPYLLKLKAGSLYEPACLVPRYLKDQGITSVVAPLPTINHTLWARLDAWNVILYPFLHGDTSWTGITAEQWQETGSIFRQLHQVTLPPSGFEAVRQETFDPRGYAQSIQTIETQHIHSSYGDSAPKRTLRSSWMTHEATIHELVTTIEKLGIMLQNQTHLYVICHADLHPANLLRDSAGHVFVLDWDEVMLAPKERDFLFVGEPATIEPIQQVASPFFQGYGETTIDWIALTYYRYERVVQDLIAFAEEVFLRDDLGEETQAYSAQMFHEILTEQGEIAAVYAAAAHLPSDLAIDSKKKF